MKEEDSAPRKQRSDMSELGTTVEHEAARRRRIEKLDDLVGRMDMLEWRVLESGVGDEARQEIREDLREIRSMFSILARPEDVAILEGSASWVMNVEEGVEGLNGDGAGGQEPSDDPGSEGGERAKRVERKDTESPAPAESEKRGNISSSNATTRATGEGAGSRQKRKPATMRTARGLGTRAMPMTGTVGHPRAPEMRRERGEEQGTVCAANRHSWRGGSKTSVRLKPEPFDLAQRTGRVARQATNPEPRPTPLPLGSRQGAKVPGGMEKRGRQSRGVMAPTAASRARGVELRAAHDKKVRGARDPGRARGECGRQNARRAVTSGTRAPSATPRAKECRGQSSQSMRPRWRL
ncbi:unnamed protein product [Sphacelaria rigidula]